MCVSVCETANLPTLSSQASRRVTPCQYLDLDLDHWYCNMCVCVERQLREEAVPTVQTKHPHPWQTTLLPSHETTNFDPEKNELDG